MGTHRRNREAQGWICIDLKWIWDNTNLRLYHAVFGIGLVAGASVISVEKPFGSQPLMCEYKDSEPLFGMHVSIGVDVVAGAGVGVGVGVGSGVGIDALEELMAEGHGTDAGAWLVLEDTSGCRPSGGGHGSVARLLVGLRAESGSGLGSGLRVDSGGVCA